MKLTFTGLMAEQGNEGENNGGSGVNLFGNKQILSGGESDEGNIGSDVSSDIDLYSSYHKLPRGSVTTPIQKSIIGEAINNTEKEDEEKNDKKDGKEDSDSKDDTSKEKDTKEKDSSKKESTTEEDEEALLEIDPTKLTTKTGKPLSEASIKTITKFKNSLQRARAEIETLKKSGVSDPQLTEKYTALEKERNELRNRIDTEHFEQSEGFKETFIKPAVEAGQRISEFFELDPTSDDFKDLQGLFGQAVESAEKGDKRSFFKIADKITSDHLEGGAAIQNIFAKEMQSLFDAYHTKAKALTDKGEERKKLVERNLEESRKKNVLSIDRDIESTVERFEASKQAVLTNLTGKEKEDYVALYKSNIPKIKQAMNEFAITGKISADLTEVINNGVTAKAIEHENKLAWTAFKDVMNQNKILKEELEKARAGIRKYTKEPDSSCKGSFVRNDSDTDTKKQGANPSKGKSIIFESLRELEKSS